LFVSEAEKGKEKHDKLSEAETQTYKEHNEEQMSEFHKKYLGPDAEATPGEVQFIKLLCDLS
jgi:hypothetical protein